MSNPDDKVQFVKEAKKFNAQFPGAIAPDGDELDFDAIFESWLECNKGKKFHPEI